MSNLGITAGRSRAGTETISGRIMYLVTLLVKRSLARLPAIFLGVVDGFRRSRPPGFHEVRQRIAMRFAHATDSKKRFWIGNSVPGSAILQPPSTQIS